MDESESFDNYPPPECHCWLAPILFGTAFWSRVLAFGEQSWGESFGRFVSVTEGVSRVTRCSAQRRTHRREALACGDGVTQFFCGLGSRLKMGQNFRFRRPALHVQAEQLISPLIRLDVANGGELNQEARDQCTVHLNLDSVGTLADEMPTAEDALQPAKKQFDEPAKPVQQHDHVSGNVLQVRHQNNVLRRTVSAASASFGVLGITHDNSPLVVIGMLDPS